MYNYMKLVVAHVHFSKQSPRKQSGMHSNEGWFTKSFRVDVFDSGMISLGCGRSSSHDIQIVG